MTTAAEQLTPDALRAELVELRWILRPPPTLSLIDWCDEFRQVASATSATPGRWRTSAQPVAYGPMAAVSENDTVTITVMSSTQTVKSELLLNVAFYYICMEPSPILLVQPTQSAAEDFSKERFQPSCEVTPVLNTVISPPRSRDSKNTITSKVFPGGSIHLVGANSPTDLASRPKRIILLDEIDKFPVSAGQEGDPLRLAEERASTFRSINRAKFVRCCSPTVEGASRIAREYSFSDQRKCFVACPFCGHEQILGWASVVWDRDEVGSHLPATASIRCSECGERWSESERKDALRSLEFAPNYGWKQTRSFVCCGRSQVPETWDNDGRALCVECGQSAPYGGHAGFWLSKLYSIRHNLSEIVTEFLESKGSPELFRKFVNTALAETWKEEIGEGIDGSGLINRAEHYGPQDLPVAVKCVTGACDVQSDRLEIQFIGWGSDEECWPFQYTIINQDPSQPRGWLELDKLIAQSFRRVDGRVLRCAAFAIDTGGHHGSQVYDFAKKRRGRRIFPTKGMAGKKPIWAGRASKTKNHDDVWPIGTDSAKDAVYGRLKIEPSSDSSPTPGAIHFPVQPGFGPQYFEQLTSERRERRFKFGVPYVCYILPPGKRNEVLDTFVYALAVRRSLPRFLEENLEYSIVGPVTELTPTGLKPVPNEQELRVDEEDRPAPILHQGLMEARQREQQRQGGWVRQGGRSWMDRGW